MFIVCKLKKHLFKVKLIGAAVFLAILLFYILPYLFTELLLMFMPRQHEMYDKGYREPLRVERGVQEEHRSILF